MNEYSQNPEQLALHMRLDDSARLDNFFVTEANQPVMAELEGSFAEPGFHSVYLYGNPGSGRSHLLQAVAQEAEFQSRRAVYLPLGECLSLPPVALLEGLDDVELCLLDDVDAVATAPEWQEALFHLFNRLRDKQRCLICSARCAPRQLQFELADLQSRLAWGTVYRLHDLDDADKVSLFIQRAGVRGLTVSQDLGEFVVVRADRSVPALLDILDRLDQASLTHKRKLTIPFVKSVLAW